MTVIKKVVNSVLFSALAIGSIAAAEEKMDSSFNVKLAISSLCTLKTIGDVDFGVVDSNMKTQTASTQLEIKCNDEKPYSIGLKTSGGDDGVGYMKSATTDDKITYNLYQDPAGNTPWGADERMRVNGVGSGKNQSIPIYVKVDGSEFEKPAGHYNDVVSVSVFY